jgi:hypothetical protein
MANTKITSRVIADNSVGIDALNVTDGTSGQALVTDGSGGLSFASVGVSGIDSSADATAITIDSSENVTFTGSGSFGSNVTALTSFNSTTGNDLRLNAGSANRDIFMQVNGSTLMTVQGSTGRVGIGDGTISPTSMLHIYKSLATADLALQSAGASGRKHILQSKTDGSLAFYDNNASSERMEILSTGQVRFQGDQTEGNGGYLSSWDDNSGIVSGGGYQTQSGWWWTSIRTSACVNDSGQIMFYANYGPGTAGQVNTVTIRAKINDSSDSGDFYTNDGSVSSLSDSRLKTNVQNLTDGLDILSQLRPVTFEYNDNSVDERGREQLGKADGITRYGFIAQEVESVAPQYVNTETGMIGGEEVDDLKSMSQTRLIPMLVKSIQELKTELDAAKARIETLENA